MFNKIMNIKTKTFIRIYLFVFLIIWGFNYVLTHGNSYFNLNKVFAALIDMLPGYLLLGFMCIFVFYVRSLRSKSQD